MYRNKVYTARCSPHKPYSTWGNIILCKDSGDVLWQNPTHLSLGLHNSKFTCTSLMRNHWAHLPWDDHAEALTVCAPVRRCPRLAYFPFKNRSNDSSTSCSHTKENERNLFFKDWQCLALLSRWATTLPMAEVMSGSPCRVLRYPLSWPYVLG